MCSTRQVIDPGNLLFGEKTAKFADPLNLTHTAIGDPTGRIRRERARIERENAPRQHMTSVQYQSLPQQQTALGGSWGFGGTTVLGGA